MISSMSHPLDARRAKPIANAVSLLKKIAKPIADAASLSTSPAK